MHPTADTPALMLRERLGAAGDAGRYVLLLMKMLIPIPILLVLFAGGCSEAPKTTPPEGAAASGSVDLRQEVAPKLSSVLPKGWSLTLEDNVLTLRRDGKVFLYNPVGMPAFGRLEDNVREFGVEGEYTIKLRFEPLLSEAEYERLKREREPFEKVVNEGARTKDEWGKGVGEYHKRPVPVYFTNRYSIFAEKSDRYPARVYPESVAVESRQVVASLDSLFRRYEEKAGRNSDF